MPLAQLPNALTVARLLVGVDVERQLVRRHVAAELLEPIPWAGADGVGGDTNPDARCPHLLELAQVRRHRLLPEAVDAATGVRDMEQDELDSRLRGSLGGRARLLEPEIVELANRGVARRAQFAVDVRVARPDVGRGLTPGELEHRLAPGPEVAALRSPAQRTLERVAVRVDEARDL